MFVFFFTNESWYVKLHIEWSYLANLSRAFVKKKVLVQQRGENILQQTNPVSIPGFYYFLLLTAGNTAP